MCYLLYVKLLHTFLISGDLYGYSFTTIQKLCNYTETPAKGNGSFQTREPFSHYFPMLNFINVSSLQIIIPYFTAPANYHSKAEQMIDFSFLLLYTLLMQEHIFYY